ncbi:MAG: ABC transporter ATP-binding protein/permease [Acidaminococcus sp.]|nr:ABC transporter ATP-binding protein/permease [Acidaminococcus sp.]MCI2100534.1 ABC transporter ATP-binding protein/permease [Acidaminococcus sp.]MCI2114855.1 ABC transporter ATP-binding protein/permease [Acidaminococcus sp.]MCI2117343.1 ABC transporter ATP-binding protein/permease [Acidaminococcus sp.]
MKKTNLTIELLRQVWHLTRSYWKSEEKKKAFLLLAAILVLNLGVVYMLVLLNEWNNAFYTALQNYQTEEIFSQLWRFTKLAFTYIVLAVYAYYLQQTLILNWRRWLTNRYMDEWLQSKTYYRLEMFGKDMDNPDQRISEDVSLFVTRTLSFFIGIIKALCTLLSFVAILWQLSGPLSFQFMGRTWTINGYMVWVAVGYAVIGTYLTHKVGHRLVGLNFVQQRYEADFRFSMMRMRENAESVAFYHGESHERKVFGERFKRLLDNFWKIVQKQKQLVWLNSGYSQIAIIFPFVVAIPRYLKKELTLGGLMQVATAFGRVQESLSYFVDVYASLAEWQAVVDRLTSFGAHMQAVREAGNQEHVERRFVNQPEIEIENLEVDLPNGQAILKPLSLTFEPGENVLIRGSSGSGKSTLLRALAGIWPFARGKVTMPDFEHVMFIPQRPYLPLGKLRDAVLYPGTRHRTDEELKALMTDCRIGYLADRLDQEADWSHVFSVGEQQRLAFVRALIYEPAWLFMDESTSALDEDTEAAMYKLLAERLTKTTLVSVGHRSTLTSFHQRALTLNKQTGEAVLSDIG